MSRKKSLRKKLALGKFNKQNKRIPLFVVARTRRRITFNKFRRNWRTDKLKLKIK